MTQLSKYTDEHRFVNFDFSPKLPSGATISSPVASSTPSGLTVGTPATHGTIAQVLISGGTNKVSYTLSMQVTVSNTEVLVTKALLMIDDAN